MHSDFTSADLAGFSASDANRKFPALADGSRMKNLVKWVNIRASLSSALKASSTSHERHH